MNLLEQYIQTELSNVADATKKRRVQDLKKLQSWMKEQDIELTEADAFDIDSFLSKLNNQGYSDNSMSSYYYSLKGFYDWLASKKGNESIFQSDQLKASKYKGSSNGTHEERKEAKEKEEIKYVTKEEKDLLKEHVPNPKIRNRLIIELMFQTGLRESEVTLIELDDIDTENREIDVFAPKTGEYRTVFYQKSLDLLLNQWIEHERGKFITAQDSDYLFISRKSERLWDHSINSMIKESAERAGIQEVTGKDLKGKRHKITSHALRHGHAVHSLKNGIDVTFIKEHLGHKEISTTQKYLKIVKSDLKEEYQDNFPA